MGFKLKRPPLDGDLSGLEKCRWNDKPFATVQREDRVSLLPRPREFLAMLEKHHSLH